MGVIERISERFGDNIRLAASAGLLGIAACAAYVEEKWWCSILAMLGLVASIAFFGALLFAV